MEYDDIFMNNKDKLEKWLDKNVISYGGDLFNILMEKELISYDDIENRFPKVNEDDIESGNEQHPQEVMQWFIVSEEGYNKFKQLDFPVIKFKELYFYGRTTYGQKMVMDFYDIRDALKIILNI
jgi:hypothetical protein